MGIDWDGNREKRWAGRLDVEMLRRDKKPHPYCCQKGGTGGETEKGRNGRAVRERSAAGPRFEKEKGDEERFFT